MKRRFLAFALFLLFGGAMLHGQHVYKYWVAFTDKEGTPFRIDRPERFLSPRALERRQRFGIAVDSLDLPVNPSYIASLRQAGFTVQNRSKWLNGVVVFSLGKVDMDDFAPFPFVDTVILCDNSSVSLPDTEVSNYGYELPRFRSPEPFSEEYYAGARVQIRQLGGRALHAAGFQGQGVVIGVCDCGFPGVDTTAIFAPMRSEGRILATRDFVWANENNVFTMHSHGTHVLSTMAAFVPGLYVGTAPKASYVLCRTENPLTETPLEEYNWVAAAEYLDSLGADVISTSLGYFNYDDSAFSYTLADLDGATAPISRGAAVAATRGLLVVNSAGNDGEAIPQHLNVPADVPQVLTVGAVDSTGLHARFSAHGPTATAHCKPDVMALGERVLSASPDGLFRYTNGTSLACPIMAGMMACLVQRFPALTPGNLCDSVRAWGSLADSPSDEMGYGLPDFSRALRTPVAINAMPVKLPFRLSPNPAKGWVTLSLDGMPIGCHMVVTDMMGRTVLSRHINQAETRICIDSWPAGTYFVHVDGNVAKLIVGR